MNYFRTKEKNTQTSVKLFTKTTLKLFIGLVVALIISNLIDKILL